MKKLVYKGWTKSYISNSKPAIDTSTKPKKLVKDKFIGGAF